MPPTRSVPENGNANNSGGDSISTASIPAARARLIAMNTIASHDPLRELSQPLARGNYIETGVLAL